MKNRREHPVRLIVATLFAIWFVAWGSELLFNDWRLNTAGRTVRAEIVDRRKSSKGNWTCTYSYKVDGVEEETDEFCGCPGTAIDYLPSQPSLTRIHGQNSLYGGSIILAMGLICLTAFGVEAWAKRR